MIEHTDRNPPTYPVQIMTVQCPCGCGALTVIPFRGILYAHLWADQIRFTVRHSKFWTSVATWPLRKGVRARLVMLEFTTGERVQCEPAQLARGHYGDLATRRPCAWWELEKIGQL